MDFILNLLNHPGVMEALLGIIGLGLTFVLNRLAGAFTAATGVKVSEKWQKDLHQGILTGVESALRKGPSAAYGDIRVHVLEHLHKSVPEALKNLAPDNVVLDNLIDRHTRMALNELGELTLPK